VIRATATISPYCWPRGESRALEPGRASLVRAGGTVTFRFDGGTAAHVVETGLSVGSRRVVTLTLQSRDRLQYRLDLSTAR
jgi:hypothetical protein